MGGHMQLRLLLLVASLGVLNIRALGSYPSVTLPEWRSDIADYLTMCDFNNAVSPYCDWTAVGLTRSQTGPGQFYISRDSVSPSGVAQLQSRILNSAEDSCLEFWYYKPGHGSSELRVLLSDNVLQTEIWSSLTAESHSWRQVFLPLSDSQLTDAQMFFELSQGQGTEKEVIFDMIGVRRGQCGSQCQSGAQFQTDVLTQCTCAEAQLTCTQITCGGGQTCRQTGISTESSGICEVASDLRYTTFDGVNFRFMGSCTHILTKVCDGIMVVPDFAVEVQKEQKSNSSVTLIQQVNVNLQGLRVTLQRRDRRRIMINGLWKHLPLSLLGSTIRISAEGHILKLETHFNLSISYSTSGALQVTVPKQFFGKLCGMCGNFNHVGDDDNTMLDGSLADDAQSLGQAWMSQNRQCEVPTQPSMCSEAEKLEYASEAYCGILLSQNDPFSECSYTRGALTFFKTCVFEMCSTQGDLGTFCDVLQAFAKTCSEAGISVIGWRNASFCPLACGMNSHFNACSSKCPASCSILDLQDGCEICEERCECDDGFLLSGGMCVPEEDCGCWVDGQHYQKGQIFMEGECKRLCLCAAQGNIQCSATSCLAHEVCKENDEVLGCFPSSPVTCSIYGDPHYITFDGKAYSFKGTCNYTIARTCTASAASFTLTARNEGRGNSTSLNSVALDVVNVHLAIRKNKLVYVNGAQVTLPYSDSTSVNVSQVGSYVQVDTNFGLRLLFNGNDRLFVQVDERHKGKMCGLCGTYSGSQFDDFLTPDGNVVPYPHDFANSWNTHDSDWTCSDGSPQEPACPPELDSEGFKECSKLFGDSFKDCHWFVPPQIFVNSCVSDHCTSGGDLSQLCTSLQNYVAACEVDEVFLGDWWKDTVCASLPTKPPPTVPATPTPTSSSESCPWSCNFEHSECGWEQLIQDSFDWTRWSGPTPTNFTGPTSDHTTGSGFYMYIEADGVHYGDSARIMSPVCDAVGTHCLTFWYHMYGSAIAMALNIYKLEDSRATKIWSRANNQGNDWHRAQIELNIWGSYQIIIEGIRGSNILSDVALDDITIMFGRCEGDSSNQEPGTPSTTALASTQTAPSPSTHPTALSQPTDFNSYHPVCKIDCNFDNNLCTWNQLLTDVFDWMRQSGSTPTPLTGPSFDHTTGNGHYIYIEGDSASHGDTARLLSEECSDPQPQCLQFWYHMYGSSWTMGMTVYLQDGNLVQEVWRMRENQGDIWHQALVDISPQNNFYIIFEGRRGHNALSDVGVDDISLHRGTCADLTNHVTTLPTPEESTTESTHSSTTITTQTTKPKPDPTIAEFTPSTPEETTPVTTTTATTLQPTTETTMVECDTSPGPVQTTPEPVPSTTGPVPTTQPVTRVEPSTSTPTTAKPARPEPTTATTTTKTETTFSECSIDDDPEYKTFDHLRHKFRGKHSYILIQTTNLPQNIREIYIEAINQKSRKQVNLDVDHEDQELNGTERGRDDSSEEDDDNHEGCLRALRIQVYNLTVEFRQGRKVMVNGERAKVPVFHAAGLEILKQASRLHLRTDFGLSVEFDGKGEAKILLPDTYKRKVEGLCGNFDDNKKNDMIKPNGEQAKDINEFGDSWKVVEDRHLAAFRQRKSSILHKLMGLQQ